MNGIFQFFRRRLVGMSQSFRVGLKIHLDLTLSEDVAGLRIKFKIRTVDLVKAAGVAPVQRNRDVVQLGAAALLELHRLAGLNFEKSVTLFGTGDGKTLRTLLNFNSDFCRHFLERILHPVPGVEIHGRDHQHQADGAGRKPATQAGYGKGHLRTV